MVRDLLQEINFGDSAAENEWPPSETNLLTAGYLDYAGYAKRLLQDNRRWFVFGGRGAGKTALAYHIEGSSVPGDFLAKVYRMGDVSLEALTETKTHGQAPSYRQLWRALVHFVLMDLAAIPPAAKSLSDAQRHQVESLLAEIGLGVNINAMLDAQRPGRSLSVRVSGDVDLANLGGPKVGGAIEINKPAPATAKIARTLNDVMRVTTDFLTKAIPGEQRIAFLDGIDDALRFGPQAFEILADLMVAVAAVNRELRENNVPLRIVALCRDDVWDELNQAELQRFRDDNGIEITWFRDGVPHDQSLLAKFLQHRVSTSVGPDVRLIGDILPPRMEWKGQSERTLRVLIEHTRHVPRDLVKMLNHIKELARENGESAPVPEKTITAALRPYYESFAGEVRNSLKGFLPDEQAKLAIDVLGQATGGEFTLKELETILARHPSPKFRSANLYEICEALFRAGGMGQDALQGDGHWIRSYRYRNHATPFVHDARLLVHPALYSATHGGIPARLP